VPILIQLLVIPEMPRSRRVKFSYRRPTKLALDAGDSAAFSRIFLASSFLCSQTESTPGPAPLTQTVGLPGLSSGLTAISQYIKEVLR